MPKDKRWVNPTDPGILRKRADVDNELSTFGYACTLFRDDQKALEMDQGKHLIPWNGVESLKIDRYDARGHLSELSQFETSSYVFVPTQEEKEIEKLCDKERYLALEPNEEEHLMYQEEEFKRLQQTLSNNEYGQVAYQYTDDSQPQATTSNSEGSSQEDVEPFVPSPLLDIPQNMILPNSKKENQIIEKAASYIAAHGSQVEIIVKTRQANNEKLGFMHVGSPLNPYYNFILDRIKHGRYRPGSLIHTQEEIEQNEDYLHPILSSSSTVESAPSIPNIAYKPSGDSSYDLLVKNIRNVQQTHEVASEIHIPPPVTKKCVPSNKHMVNGRLSSKNHNSTKKITVKDNPQKVPPPNIREIISKLLNFARTMGLHPSELAPNLLMKKSKNIEFLLPENPYHWFYKEQLGLLFKDKEESVQRSETSSSENSAYDPEALTDNTESSLTNSEEVTTDTDIDRKEVNTKSYPSVVEGVITEEENPKDDEARQLLMDDDDSLGNDSDHSVVLSGKDLKQSRVLSPQRSNSCENHVSNQPSHRPVAPVSFSIKKPREEKLEIQSALPVEESSSEEEGDENCEKAVKSVVKENSAEKTTVGEDKMHSKTKDNKPEHDFSNPQYAAIPNKMRKLLLEEDQPPRKTEETLQGNDSKKNVQKVFVKPAPSTLNGIESIETVNKQKARQAKKKDKSTKVEKQRDKKTERKPSKTSIDSVKAPSPPKEVASPLPPSPLASPPPPDVDRVKKEERKKRAKVLISKLKNVPINSAEFEEESSQELEELQVQNSSVTSTALRSQSNIFSPIPPLKFTSFLPSGPDVLLHNDVEELKIVEKDSKHKEEHLRKRVKKSLQELARNMNSIISSQSDEEDSPPLVATNQNNNTKVSSVAAMSNVTNVLSSGSNKSCDGCENLYFVPTFKKIRPSATLEVTESLLTSLAKTNKNKKYVRDSSSDSSSSSSSDSSTDTEEESISDASINSSQNYSKKRSLHKHSKHSHKKRKKHYHHSNKYNSSKHSKKSYQSHRKRSRRTFSSSSE